MFFKVKLFFLSFFDREGLNIDRQVDKKMLRMKVVVLFILIQLGFVLLVSEVLWPRVMPKLFKSAVPNPGFMAILGLSVIAHLLI